MIKLFFKYRMFCALVALLVAYVGARTVFSISAQAEEMIDDVENTEESDYIKTARYNIYDGDYSTYKSKLAKTIEVDESLPLVEKVRRVASSLSETLYDDLPIEVTIEDRSCKKVAIINLVEKAERDNKKFQEIYAKMEDKKGTWQNYFDQGDAKSIITIASLESTFYQEGVQGEWIDGFMIYHNGETIDDHRGMTTTSIKWIK